MSQNTSDNSSANLEGPNDTTDLGDKPSSTDSASPSSAAPQRPAQWWTRTAATTSRVGTDRLTLVRLGWTAAIALALLITWGAGPDSIDWQEDVSFAQETADLNNDRAEGAPQQQVVNGWYTADLAEIQIMQNAKLIEQQALTGNLLLVLGLGIFGDLALRAVADRQHARDRSRRQGATFPLTG